MTRGLLYFFVFTAIPLLLVSLSCGNDQNLLPDGNCNPAATNVLLIVIDTLRADHLSLYGYERRTCPNLEELAQAATVFVNAFCSSTWTVPAHASLFTGKYPFEHGAHNLRSENYEVGTLADDHLTLAEVLKEEDFSTCAIIGNAGYLAKVFGLYQGFDEYRCDAFRRAPGIASEAIKWMKDHPHFFLFLNFFEPHQPHRPPAPFSTAFPGRIEGFSPHKIGSWRFAPEKKAHIISQYDGEILFTDFYLGTIFDALKKNNTYDDTMIIVTSDHGELLGEKNCYGHRQPPYEALIKIPLIIKFPGQKERRTVHSYIQLVDIMPMILRLFDIPLPHDLKNRGKPRKADEVLSQFYLRKGGSVLSGREGRYKLLVNEMGGKKSYELYDLAGDPEETVNLAGNMPEKVREMEGRIRDMIGSGSRAGTAAVVDESLKKKLIELGYLTEDGVRQAGRQSNTQHLAIKQKDQKHGAPRQP